jgi:hypothetical protein
MPTQEIESSSEDGAAGTTKLNWLDKAVWAVAKTNGEEHVYNIILVKVAFATSLMIYVGFVYRFLWKIAGVIDHAVPGGNWSVLLLIGLCYIPIHFATRSSAEILAAELPRRERWIYAALGFLFCPIGWVVVGVFFAWLESGFRF